MYLRFLIITALVGVIGLCGLWAWQKPDQSPQLTIELGSAIVSPGSHKVSLPFETTATLAYKNSQLDSRDAEVWLKAGTYLLTREDGSELEVVIQDQTAPTLTLNRQTAYCYVNDDLSQIDWTDYLQISDYSSTATSYTVHVDTSQVGNGEVVYTVKDQGGNQSTINLPLKVVARRPGFEDVDWLASYEMFDLQNAYRQAQGLEALEWDDSLIEMAYTRCAEIGQRYSHIRPNGTSYASLFTHSYDYHAENISACNKDAKSLFEDWSDRPTFSANMLDENMLQGVILHVADSWVGIYTG